MLYLIYAHQKGKFYVSEDPLTSAILVQHRHIILSGIRMIPRISAFSLGIESKVGGI